MRVKGRRLLLHIYGEKLTFWKRPHVGRDDRCCIAGRNLRSDRRLVTPLIRNIVWRQSVMGVNLATFPASDLKTMLAFLLLAVAVPDASDAWTVYDQTDNILNTRRISALVLANDHDGTATERPSLHMNCREGGGVDLLLVSNLVDFGKRQRPVYITFLGNGQVIDLDVQLWQPSMWQLTYSGVALEGLVETSARTPIVRFEYLVDAGRQTVFYKTSGMEKAYRYLRKNCQFNSTGS